ncbi:MAG: hypothetical protein K9M99_02290 [Candidatus Cloacimonetes bacterium]|nr:hypothetical protein [Candidatus Cloacimonadota bacterium]
MNRAFPLILIFLCLYFALAAKNLQLQYALDYSFWGNYYPDQGKKEITYKDLLDLETGLTGQFGKVDSLWLTISFYNDQYEKSVRLEKTGFCLNSADWQYGYLYERNAGIGRYSRIYPQILYSKYHLQPYIISYNASGAFLTRQTGNSNWKFVIGGNEFNSFCSSLDWQLESAEYLHDLQILVMSRDNYYLKGMASINYEGYRHWKWLWLSAAGSAQYLVSHSDSEDLKIQSTGFAEAIILWSKWLQTGANMQGRWLGTREKEKQFTVFTGMQAQKHSIRLLYNQEEWEIANRMECFSTVYWYEIRPGLKAGGLARMYMPQYGADFYEVGMQVSFRK